MRRAAGKLLCRLSARVRGRRSPPRAVCSGSVPRGAGTTSNRAEPGRCLREGTGVLAVPPGAGHPRNHRGHLTAVGAAECLSHLRGRQHPGPPWDWCWCLRDDGMGTRRHARSAVPYPAPRGAPLVPAPLWLSAPSLLHASCVCLRVGWGELVPDWAHWDPILIQSGPVAQYPLALPPCPLFGCCSWVGIGQITARPGPPQPALPRAPACRVGVSGPSPLQPAVAATVLWRAGAAVTTVCHLWVGQREATWLDPGTWDH